MPFPRNFHAFAYICLFFKQRDQEQYEIYNIYEPFTFIPRKLLKQTNIYYFNVWLRPVILTFGLFVLSPFDLNLASRCVILMWLIRLFARVNIIVKKFFWLMAQSMHSVLSFVSVHIKLTFTCMPNFTRKKW